MLLSSCLLFPQITTAETVVTNSVSVSASGSGENSASVTTIINNEVVEDWSSNSVEPIKYSNYISASSSTETRVHASSEEVRLKEMIIRLEALISLYVSLLKQ